MGITVWTIPDMPLDEAERERAVRRSGALTITDTRTLTEITAQARAQLGTAMAFVTIVYQDSAYLIAASGFAPGVYRRSTSFCGHTILEDRQPFVVADTSRDERFAGNPLVVAPDGIRFYAGFALLDDAGLPIGTLCVMDDNPRTGLSVGEEERLSLLAGRVMTALRTARG